MEQRRGHFLMLGVWVEGDPDQIDLVKVSLALSMSIAVLPAHFLRSLINPTGKMAWLVAC